MRINKRLVSLFLGVIFLIALGFRFYAFKESVYFGFDQAKDAYESQDIYVNRNIKIMGLPATGNMGIFHGPLHWYLTGPIYLLAGGDPIGVSAFFRVINAMGVFLVFAIGSGLFNSGVGLMAALMFAMSYEETQYSMYVGNPSMAMIFIPLIFLGASWIYKKSRYADWSLVMMFGGAAAATQLNLMYAYSFAIVLSLLFILRRNVTTLLKKSAWIKGFVTAGLLLASYFIAELKFDFRETKTVIRLLRDGFGVMSPGQSKYLLYWDKYLSTFRDNVFGLVQDQGLLVFLVVAVTTVIVIKSVKEVVYRIVLLWMLSWIFLMMLGGHTGYYTNAGLGVGVIIAMAALVNITAYKNRAIVIAIILVLIGWGNMNKVAFQSPKSLIPEMITQNGMRLVDEYYIIDQMYSEANGRGFTVRLTGIPYRIQSVWAYILNHYAMKKYGYLPYWETGNAFGFPGSLPVPVGGTTCLRFLVREPMRGLPGNIIEGDEKEENKFSKITNKREINFFMIESRISTDKVCHNNRPK